MILLRSLLSGLFTAVTFFFLSTVRLGLHLRESVDLAFIAPGIIFGILVLSPEISDQGFTLWWKRGITLLATTFVYAIITHRTLKIIAFHHEHDVLIFAVAGGIGAGLIAILWWANWGKLGSALKK